MLSIESLTAEQEQAATHLYMNDATILVAATGVGKTAIALTAIQRLLQSHALRRVIVACPAKVVANHVWSNEADRWEHLKNIRVLELDGVKSQREKNLASYVSDVIVVSLNNLDWLLAQNHGCDGIVIDELSKAAGKQTRALRYKGRSGGLVWRVGMTATPVSQNFEKIFSYCRVLDGGKAFGTNKSHFMAEYFNSDYMGYNWTIKPGADATIMAKAAPLVHLVSDNKAETLPPLHEKVQRFDMPEATRAVYNDMKRHMIAEDVVAANQAVKSGKLRQIASGFMYNDGKSVSLDAARFEAYCEWEANLNHRPGLVFYEFVGQAAWAELAPDNITFAQINSMSHGVDGLQYEFADVLFVQPVWSRDSYEQAVGRVHRQGQLKPVTVTTLVCHNTLDDLVMARVENNGQWMKMFKQHLAAE